MFVQVPRRVWQQREHRPSVHNNLPWAAEVALVPDVVKSKEARNLAARGRVPEALGGSAKNLQTQG